MVKLYIIDIWRKLTGKSKDCMWTNGGMEMLNTEILLKLTAAE